MDAYQVYENSLVEDDEDILLFYDEERNVMIDFNGRVVFNIFEIISPNVLFLFKKHKEHMVVRGRNGVRIELIWPEHDEY